MTGEVLRLARLHHPVTALGPGRRIGIWFQGCTIACRGCISQDTWAADDSTAVGLAEVVAWCRAVAEPELTGVTVTGGEPSEQPVALAALLAGLAPLRRRYGWDVLCYTGVEEDEFARRCPEAYALVDALVTGPYRVGEPTELAWRGSANQRLLPLTDLGRSRYAAWVDAALPRPHLQIQVDDDRVWMIGVPRRGDLTRLRSQLAAQQVRWEAVSWRP